MTTGIKLWSSTPGSNNSSPPLGAPEGMAPSGVNDVIRQNMAEVRKWYEDSQWVDFGSAGLAYFDATNFVVTGDQTATYQVGRRVRAIGTTPFTIYGRITASVFSTTTKVTVAWDSGSLDATLSEVALGPSFTGLPSDVPAPQTSIASATTTDLGTIASANALITGTTTITSFGSSAITNHPLYFIEFSGILTLTYNATSMILPTAASITTAAGDTAIAEYLGSGNWKVRDYVRFSGLALVSPTVPTSATTAETKTGTDTAKFVTPAGLKGALGLSQGYSLTPQGFGFSTTLTFAHGLGVIPQAVQVNLINVSAEGGYTAGQVLPQNMGVQNVQGGVYGMSVVCDATNVKIYISSAYTILSTSYAFTTITAAKWNVGVNVLG